MADIETLLTEQNLLFKWLSNLEANVGKRNNSDKQPASIQRHLKASHEKWENFELNDSKLKEFEDSSDEYFQQEIFIKGRALYDKYVQLMARLLELGTVPQFQMPTPQTNADPSEKVTEDKMDTIMSMLSKLAGEVEELKKKPKMELVEKFPKYQLPTEQIFGTSMGTSLPYAQKAEQVGAVNWGQSLENNSLAQNWGQTLGGVPAELPRFQNSQEERRENSQSQSDQLTAKLIDATNAFTSIGIKEDHGPALQRFDGTPQEFRSWRMLFNKKVHDKAIPKIVKLEKLKLALSGEAYQLISFIDITEENYENALAIIDERYYDPQNLMDREVDDFLKLLDSNFGAGKSKQQRLRETHDLTQRVFGNLKNLVQEVNFPRVQERQQPHFKEMVAQEILDTLVSRIITTTLDGRSNEKLQQFRSTKGITKNQTIKLANILEFLQQEFRDLAPQALKTKPMAQMAIQHGRNHQQRGNQQGSFHCTVPQCYVCDSNKHVTLNCQQFLKLTIKERRIMTRKLGLCYSCVLYKHNECECKAKGKSLPNKFLVYPKDEYQKDGYLKDGYQKDKKECPSTRNHKTHMGMGGDRRANTTLLATARCVVLDKVGHPVVLRALIDPGSTCSFITKQAALILKLARTQTQVSIQGIGKTHLDADEEMEITIKPHFMSSFEMKIDTIIVESITDLVPARIVHVQRRNDWPHPLADPSFDHPGKIDILLSATEMPWLLINNAIIEVGEPIMQETKLGFIIYGPAKENAWVNEARSFVVTTPVVKISDMERFWEIEIEQEDDQSVEEFFMSTTFRNEDGSYTVQIPFKDEKPVLGDSKGRAMARLLQNERRLGKNPERLELYNSTLREYVQLGHMRLVTNQSLGKYYIPHQAVIKEDSVTTPLRVVFDASSRSSNGKSLNEIQHVGPRLQQDLQMMLLKFRKHKIAVVSDITKMYRQIKMAEKDIPYQRVLWRDGIHGPIQEYELTTVTFGLAAAPYLAIRTLLRLAADEEQNFPEGARLIRNNFYVDDLLSSFASVEQAQQEIKSLVQLTQAGQFKLRKWATSNPEALKYIDSKDLLSAMEIMLSEDKSDAIKALGVKWTPTTDKMHINIQINEETMCTKRKAMSVSAKIFDPLGILAPATVVFKMLIQDIWKTELGWDEKVPNQIAAKWAIMQKEIHILETIRVPRWIRYEPNVKHALIGFSDASEKAYGAVIYFKSGDQVTLIAARTKVAPIKRPATLPRLELLGALLLADLNAKTMEALDLDTRETEILAFSDSQITLAWIQGDHNRWKKFVSTRTNKIVSRIPRQNWFYVDTKENPADHASRGLSPSELVNCSLWWNGPEFLRGTVNIPTNVYNTNLETKNMNKEMVHVSITKEKYENATLKEIITYHSSWFRMVRVLAWCARALSKNKPEELRLESAELDNAETILIKYVQQQEFPQELATLQKGNAVSVGNLANYNVTLDKKGVIRVGGRLNHATIPHAEKHPIVLPKVSGKTVIEHSLTVCIIEWAHTQTLHGGVGLTTTYLRQKYLVMGMRNSIKYCLHRCHTCRRFKTETLKQQMGTLPKDRVTMAPPFANCSVDYAGPFVVKSSGIRGAKKYKCYIAVFVCLATKAYHLELVSALTAVAFVQAFKRFIGRRGLVKMVRSDNGGNFVKGNKILNREMNIAIKEGQELAIEAFVGKGLEWKFMPPLAPHFGGLHEAAVKSVKNHLKKTIGEVCLTYEDFATVLIQIEAQINSRPLITNQIDGMILTPAHFLIGRTMNTMPEPRYLDVQPTNRYRLQQQLQQRFWETWHKEYLHQLQQRPKWTIKTKNLEVNQLVLLKNELAPPTQWKKGVVVETHPGKDGLIRVVSVTDEEGNKYKRELNKIIVLPVAPFISGGENPVVPEGYRKLPPRQQKTNAKPPVKPVRRSPRNVRSNLITRLWSPGNAFMMMMMMMVAVLIVNPICGENLTVHELPKDGILFSHQTTLIMKNGFAEIHIPTNIKNSDQRDNIQTAVLIMHKSCEYLLNLKIPLDECVRSLREVQEKARMVKGRIAVVEGKLSKTTHVNRSKRTKRSKGVLTWLWKFLIGTDEEQEQTDRTRKTAAVVQHSMQAFESIEKELQARQKMLHNQATRMRGEVDKMTGVFQLVNKATVELQAQMLKTRIIHHLEIIEHNYDMIMDPQWEEQEMTEAIEETRKNLGIQHDIPALSVQQLRMLSTTRIIEKNGSLELVITIPTVQRQRFEEFDIWPIPDLVTKTIIEMETKTIALNNMDKLYFYPTASDKRYNINESVALIDNTVVHVAVAGNDCVVDAVFQTATNKRRCTTQKLSNEYDEWHQLPVENQYAFYTAYPTEAAQMCKNSRIPINKAKGILIVTPGCQVVTRNHRIFGKHAEQLRKGYSFQIDVITEKPLQGWPVKPVGMSHSKTLPPVHVGKLIAAEQEASQLALALQENSQWWVIVGVVCATVTIMLVIGMVYIMYGRSPQQQSTKEVIEMTPVNKPSARVWSKAPTTVREV